MARNSAKQKSALQSYPRRPDSYIADDVLFPRPQPLADFKLRNAIKAAFERMLKRKTGTTTSPHFSPAQLVQICLVHLQQRGDPILNPSFLSQCELEDVFAMDAIAHEMQRHRMKIGNFYQFLVIELMKTQYPNVYDGKREGDVEAELNTPAFERGIRLFISVKKSSDTVGGQDIGGVFRRLETLAKQDKNLTRPYMGVVAVATPPKGMTDDYQNSRTVRFQADGSPYSPNCEVWYPGFIYPFVCGREASEVYKEALKQVSNYLPFNTLKHEAECAKILVEELKKLGLVSPETGRIDPQKFQEFVSRARAIESEEITDE